MRSPSLILSMLVHGGAIGAAAAIGVHASEEVRRPPHVEIRSSSASVPALAQLAVPPEAALEVTPETSPMPTDLPEDPIVPEPELYRAVVDLPERAVWPGFRVSLARIRPVEPVVEPVEPPAVEPVEERAPPAVAPAPASVHVAASPRSDNLAPPYPEHERALGREGTVLVTARVDIYGLVIGVELARPSRYAGFNGAALAAVRTWRFTPGTIDGAPTEDEVDVPVVFRLEDIR